MIRVSVTRSLRAVRILVAVLAAGCSIKQVAPPTPPLSVVARGERVLLLPPRVVYQSVETDREVSGAEHGEHERAIQLESGVRSRLAASGLSVTSVDDLSAYARQEAVPRLDELRARYPRLIGAARDKSAFRPALAELGRLSGAPLACVVLLNIRVGKGGGYDPNSGQIWTTTSSTSLRVAVVSLSDGERRWLREAFMRSMANARDLERALDVIFGER